MNIYKKGGKKCEAIITKHKPPLVTQTTSKNQQHSDCWLTVINTHIFIINLNTDSLNSATKRHKLTEWIRKQNPSICYLQEVHFSFNDSHYFRVKNGQKYSNQMEAGSKQTQLSYYLRVCLFLVKIKWGRRAGTLCAVMLQSIWAENGYRKLSSY